MRLSKLKLSGFKSFVDPITVTLPSDLIGIVGPNGCGKSNIIDAVRWVMGESSAKHLRGDSMADVIFNGAAGRKPVGQATVEMIFDNSDGTLGGEYASFSEISIKRTVSRDGLSVFHLNGARCRRRDITDIFLGTGLGPRSYAIIEQGTISRIIEAKPEDMRLFLEEAAGTSKYKERRRETETRIRHTRDNLDRLSDIRDELEKQLARLKRQARAAERYKTLREEGRLLKAQLQALHWQDKNAQAEQIESGIRGQETALEAALAEQRNIESSIEHQRDSHIEVTDRFNAVQSRFYSVGAEIARLEQSIQHAKERRQQQQQDLAQIELDWNEAQSHLTADRNTIADLQASLTSIEPAYSKSKQEEQQVADALSQAEQDMHDWQAEWEAFNQHASEPAQNAEVERTRIQHQEAQLAQLQTRLSQAEEELGSQPEMQLGQEVTALQQQLAQRDTEIQQGRAALSQQQGQIGQLRDGTQQLNTKLDEVRSKLQDLRGRYASQEALQQAALGKEQGAISEWLTGQQLQDAPRLAEGLEVENGWEHAVECVLGAHLEAVCVNGLDDMSSALDTLTGGILTLFDTTAQPRTLTAEAGTPLLDKVKASWGMDTLLAGVYAVDTLQQALDLRSRLAAHESVVTRDGLWLGNGWLRVVRDKDEKAGVLQREQTLKSLAAEIEQEGQQAEKLQQQLDTDRDRLAELEATREALQSKLNQTIGAHAELQAELGKHTAHLEQAQSHRLQLELEVTEAQSKIEQETQLLREARGRLQQALEQMSGLEQQRSQLTERRDEFRQALDVSRQNAKTTREAAQRVTVRTETLRTELTTTQMTLQRMENQLQQLAARREELQKIQAEGDVPQQEMESELTALLEKRVAVEAELAAARKAMEEIDHKLRKLEEERSLAEDSVGEVREQLEHDRIGWQEVKVRRQTLEEQIQESGFALKQLIEEMPEEATDKAWQEQVENMERKINRLGPINLAAIDEYEQLAERKTYLDAQDEDITEALKTLENAIKKIDSETRTRFKETFDKVNAKLQELFPRLFGGGIAYLEMTDDDLLDTGITIMARPPGKRISTINLMSGGEKALTAVALVFAIFELNPAPFCMLDEVDAPLDDANVGRYCDLLLQMSEKTQFIFITHNKLTMEVAKHLTGVTMHEPGVSRLVAVDVDEAVELATA